MSSFTEAERAAAAIRSIKKDEEFLDHLRSVDRYPHKAQIKIMRKVLNDRPKYTFLQCSRNWGKSTFAAISAVLHAGRTPRSRYYIFAPYRPQAAEIYWASGLLEMIIPPSWIKSETQFNKSEMRITFDNKSFIKVDGADNEGALRGIKPTGATLDEFQEWSDKSWFSIEPNFLAVDAPITFIGTPPDQENIFTKLGADFQAQMKGGNPRYFYTKQTIHDNPLIPAALVDELKRGYFARGEEAIWKREYLAEFIKGGAAGIFPQFTEAENVRPGEWIRGRLQGRLNSCELIVTADPSSTRFAMGFYIYDRDNSTFYQVGEILETDRTKIFAGAVIDRARKLEAEHFGQVSEPLRVYDEAAALFALEAGNYGYHMSATQKRHNQKSNNISLVREAFYRKKMFISTECPGTIRDIQSYHTNDRGMVVKKDDDLVDCLLYAVAETEFSFTNQPINAEPSSHWTTKTDLIKNASDDSDFAPRNDMKIEPVYLEEMWDW